MAKSRPALEFKGRMLSLTRVRILEMNPTAIEAQLNMFTRSLGEAAAGLPVVLDADQSLDLKPVLALMRSAGLQPIAALDGALAFAARASGLAVLSLDLVSDASLRASLEAAQPPPEPAAPAPSAPAVHKPARVITDHIRSGQQIYAEGSDLIVMSTVSPGAEVIADGCIHVYGQLRGRAIAGARGDDQARIFCKIMEAELLAVAGIYAVADQMKGALRGQPVQAFLVNGQLRIEKLEA
ncbi:MAG: septum site-determining protein MinC [Panacagrimonas sp.]